MGDITPKDAYRLMLTEYPDLLSFEQMCEILKISQKTGYKLLRENKVRCLKTGRAYRIPKHYLLTYMMIGTETT